MLPDNTVTISPAPNVAEVDRIVGSMIRGVLMYEGESFDLDLASELDSIAVLAIENARAAAGDSAAAHVASIADWIRIDLVPIGSVRLGGCAEIAREVLR